MITLLSSFLYDVLASAAHSGVKITHVLGIPESRTQQSNISNTILPSSCLSSWPLPNENFGRSCSASFELAVREVWFRIKASREDLFSRNEVPPFLPFLSFLRHSFLCGLVESFSPSRAPLHIVREKHVYESCKWVIIIWFNLSLIVENDIFPATSYLGNFSSWNEDHSSSTILSLGVIYIFNNIPLSLNPLDCVKKYVWVIHVDHYNVIQLVELAFLWKCHFSCRRIRDNLSKMLGRVKVYRVIIFGTQVHSARIDKISSALSVPIGIFAFSNDADLFNKSI